MTKTNPEPAAKREAATTPRPRRGNGTGKVVTVRLPASLFDRLDRVRDEIEPSHQLYYVKGTTDMTLAIVDRFVRELEVKAEAKTQAEKEKATQVPRGMTSGRG